MHKCDSILPILSTNTTQYIKSSFETELNYNSPTSVLSQDNWDVLDTSSCLLFQKKKKSMLDFSNGDLFFLTYPEVKVKFLKTIE